MLGNLAFRSTIPLCQTEFDQLIDPFCGTHYKKRWGVGGICCKPRKRDAGKTQEKSAGSENGFKSLGIQGNKIVTHFVLFEVIS